MIICWSSVDYLMIIWWLFEQKQANKQTNMIDYLMMMNCWLSDILMIIYPLFWCISVDHLMIVCWSFDYNLFIIWWSYVNYMKKTNKQTKVVKYLIINCWLSDNLMIIYLMIWWSYDDHLLIIWRSFDYHLLIICKENKQTNK